MKDAQATEKLLAVKRNHPALQNFVWFRIQPIKINLDPDLAPDLDHSTGWNASL
jgi:hypothetical protein